MGNYKKSLIVLFLTLFLLLTGVSSALADQPNPNPGDIKMHNPVTFCHARPPDTAAQGYGPSSITVDDDSIIKQGHGSEHAADIIPQFLYDVWEKTGDNYGWVEHTYPGKNMATGQAILNNNCQVSSPQTRLTCDGITVDPAFTLGNKFSFDQTYTFTPVITGAPASYNWSINPTTPAILSTNLPTTSWKAPATANPGTTWTLSLSISDDSKNTASCFINFLDPTDQVTDNDVCANIDGIQTSVPGGLHLDASGRNCVDYNYGGPSSAGTTGQVLGASTSGQVLGASTTAKTGLAQDVIGSLLIVVGLTTTLTSAYAYRKAFAN